MKIQFLGHAGFSVDCGSDVILCDPWFSPFGAYAASWFPFPANDSIDLNSLECASHLYISHWHEDHLDEWFLKSRSEKWKREVVVIIPKFQYSRLRDVIRECGYGNIIEVEEEDETANGTRIYIQRDENPLYSDSSIVIASNGYIFVNSNDCKLTIGQEEEILQRFGEVTVYAAQFSGATFHPTCYDYPREKNIEISRVRREAKFQRIVNSMERLKAKAYIPSAGPACFLDPELFRLNLSFETVFSTASDFYSWLPKREERHWEIIELIPGEQIGVSGLKEKRSSGVFESKEYLNQYVKRRQISIQKRVNEFVIPEFNNPEFDIVEAAKEHFRSKLASVPALAKRANVIVELRIRNRSFFVNTAIGSITDIPPPFSKQQHYRLELSEFWIRAILAGKFRWEDLLLSFRFTIHRDPDVYNEAFVAFLQLDTEAEREDYVHHLELLERRDRERIRRMYDGYILEYDRFCPHNCEDLSNAKIENGVLTCPRHFWRFSLDDGRGLNNPGNIHVERMVEY